MKLKYLVAITVVLAACSGQSPDNAATNNGGDYGRGTNNAGGGAGSSDAGDYVPDQEEDFSFSAPAVVGEHVYVANETLNSVAVIDSRNLSISTRQVGFRPTQIAGPDAQRAQPGADANVMVLDEGSHAVSILATDSTKVTTVEVMAHANRLAMEPTGTTSVAWYDPASAKASDPAGDLSSVSVVQDGKVYAISVGFHVRSVFFDDAGTRALVLTDDGISVIDLTSLSGDAIAPPTPVVPVQYQTSQPEDLEVLVSHDGKWAVTRSATFEGVVLLDIDSGEHHFLPLPEIPSDIDLIDDGHLEVLIMLRGHAQAVRATIPDGLIAAADAMTPAEQALSGTLDAGLDAGGDAGTDAGADTGASLDAGTDAGADASSGLDAGLDAADASASSPDAAQTNTFAFPTGIDGFHVADVVVPGMGAASVAQDGQTALLFTTLGGEKRAVLYDLADDTQRTLAFEKGVRGALSDRSGHTFLVFHTKEDGPIPPDATPADPEYIARSWGVSVLDVASAATRLVLTDHEPGQATLWSPDEGDHRVYLIFKAPAPTGGQRPADIEPSYRDVLTINLRSFRSDSFRVPSLPEGLGPIPSAGRIYISQRHPQGRMTFVDADTGARQTITGYQLNAGIE